MVYLPLYTTWLAESHKLIAARPDTVSAFIEELNLILAKAKISSKYRFPAPGKATLILKTYDPVSGTCLKYKTDKSAEVGRLVSSLGGLGKRSLGLEVVDDWTTFGVVEEGTINT
jgi:hypothetical protein